MIKRNLLLAAALTLAVPFALFAGGKDKKYVLESPDGNIRVEVNAGSKIEYSVSRQGVELITPSEISMTLDNGSVLGENGKLKKAVKRSVDEKVPTLVYKKAEVRDNFNELSLQYKDYSVIFRAYDSGVAYRFTTSKKNGFNVKNEKAEFNFADDWSAYVGYANAGKPGDYASQFHNSFENYYAHHTLSNWEKGKLAFLPLTVEAEGGIKVCITESDLLDYPGMYLVDENESKSLKGVWAPYPKEVSQGGHNMLEGLVDKTEDYIAKAPAKASFPWRVICVAAEDKDLLANDLVWLLATPQIGEDYSWVKPGKVAWDWWNGWNLYGVDFVSGINNDTYKYYIDFAASKGIEYVILDEGWAVNKKADLMQVVPEINLPELAKYAEGKGVGLILWAGYWAFNRDIEGVCKHYSKMGIKGFKIDFMNRDDQVMVDFFTTAAKTCAKYHLLADFHGAFKPSGLTRTYPNVLNFEGVNGLENMKWEKTGDQVTYDVTLPFTRCVAGPMDYTQGAMRNAIKANYRPVYNEAMSQGTRCRQIAEYVVFDSPLNMLCDSPSNYLEEPECTKFIAEFPTTWDETVPLEGKIASYVAVAKRKGGTWYVGAMTSWDERDMTLDLGFLGNGNWKMEVFRDGVNASKAARDFVTETVSVPSDKKVTIHMAPGGGWAARIYK